jgi:hypothetical protein
MPRAVEQRAGAGGWLACARHRRSSPAFGLNEVKDGVESNTREKVQFAFRRPRFPVIYAVGTELFAALSPAAFRLQIERLEFRGAEALEMVDATGEGWVFHSDLMIVSPLTLRKRWKEIDIVRLFNESANARRIGAAYPEAYIPRRPLARIIEEIAALVAYAKPNMPLQRTGVRAARPGR